MRNLIVKGDSVISDLIDAGTRDREFGWLPVKGFRKLIDGVIYDSELLDIVAEHEVQNPAHAGRCEKLYMGQAGEFLLAGEGNPNSPWSKGLPDRREYGSAHGFVPLTKAQAKQWLEIRRLDDEYFAIFGKEDQGTIKLLLELPQELAGRAQVSADAKGLGLREWSIAALDDVAARSLS